MTNLKTARWIEDQPGLMVDPSEIGGDIQLDDGCSRRWHAPYTVSFPAASTPRLPMSYTAGDPLHLVVTAYWFPAEMRDEQIGVARTIEYLLCTDRERPGETEVWSDYRYHEETSRYATVEEAQSAAWRTGEAFDADAVVHWRGDLTV